MVRREHRRPHRLDLARRRDPGRAGHADRAGGGGGSEVAVGVACGGGRGCPSRGRRWRRAGGGRPASTPPIWPGGGRGPWATAGPGGEAACERGTAGAGARAVLAGGGASGE